MKKKEQGEENIKNKNKEAKKDNFKSYVSQKTTN